MTYDLDQLLAKRRAPEHDPQLALRIMAAARQQRPVSFLNELMLMFVMPKPGYALAASLLLGLMLGFGFDLGSADATETVRQSDVLYYLNEGNGYE